jgi:antitoxin CptB
VTDDLELRRKRALYRAAHRGTKEMDVLIGRYADAKLPDLSGEDLNSFERIIEVADPTLQAWIFGKEPVAGIAFEHLVQDIRSFHGLVGLEHTTE